MVTRRLPRCPLCNRPLQWFDIGVDAGSDGLAGLVDALEKTSPHPEMWDMAYADCACGLGLTLDVPDEAPEDNVDPDTDQPELGL